MDQAFTPSTHFVSRTAHPPEKVWDYYLHKLPVRNAAKYVWGSGAGGQQTTDHDKIHFVVNSGHCAALLWQQANSPLLYLTITPLETDPNLLAEIADPKLRARMTFRTQINMMLIQQD